MNLAPGTELPPYRLLAKIGEGGMGIVWKAEDLQLGRDAAIKVLPDAFAQDPDRLARFEREARVLASLNHPNIAAIHGLHQAEAFRFLAMEFVDGEDLSQRISRGAIGIDDTLEIGRQIASALEAAHDNGIVHRDLKPANVRLKPSGQVKVLDFGLAKAVPTTGPFDTGGSISPTLTSAGTAPTAEGAIIGTAAYMSPEQARGKPQDRRTDLWAFGCLLYEMLTGTQAFAGETLSDSLAAVLRSEPDFERLPEATPAPLRRLVRRCLQKDPARRQRDAGDALISLQEAGNPDESNGGSPAAATVRAETHLRPNWILAVGWLTAGALLTAAAWTFASTMLAPPAATPLRLAVPLDEELNLIDFGLLLPYSLDLSTDGKVLAILAKRDETSPSIYVRELEQSGFRNLPGAEGAIGQIRFSPDATEIFYLTQSPTLRLMVVQTNGTTPPSTRIELDGTMGHEFVVLPSGDLLMLEEGAASFRRLPRGAAAWEPAIAIEGRATGTKYRLDRSVAVDDDLLLMDAITYDRNGWGVRVDWLEPRTGRTGVLIEDGGRPSLAIPGHVLFSRGDVLLAAPWSPRAKKLTGPAKALLSGMRTMGRFLPAIYKMSANGTLIFAPGGRVGENRTLKIRDDDEDRTWPVEPRAFSASSGPNLSDDGSTFAVLAINDQGLDEIWVTETESPRLRRVGAFPGSDCGLPLLNGNGSLLAFSRQGEERSEGIYVVPTDGSVTARKVFDLNVEGQRFTLENWARDDGALLVRWTSVDGDRSPLGWITIPAEGTGEFVPIAGATPRDFALKLSPDGRWISMISTRQGQNDLFVARFDGSTVGSLIRVAEGRANGKAWAKDRDGVYFVTEDGRLQFQALSLGNTLRVDGEPELIRRFSNEGVVGGAVSSDGRLIEIVLGDREGRIPYFEVLLESDERFQTLLRDDRN